MRVLPVGVIPLLALLGCTATRLLAVGTRAPALRAQDQAGRTVSLGDFRGAPLALYFYPRDGTPGCTREACAFRDVWARYEAAGVRIVGVSTDDVASHARFAREHRIPFPLLADTDARIARDYGVGRTFGMVSRVTYLLDGEGIVRRVFPEVDPGVHATQVLAAAQALAPPGR